ncbi:hypothetical protein SMICM17S_03328 [Streptomyces microflavus]
MTAVTDEDQGNGTTETGERKEKEARGKDGRLGRRAHRTARRGVPAPAAAIPEPETPVRRTTLHGVRRLDTE